IDLRRHVRQLKLNRLKLRNRFSELLPLLRVTHRRLIRALRDTNRERRDRDTSTIEHFHRVYESHSFFTQQLSVRHEAVFKNNARRLRSTQSELVLFLRRRETLHPFFEDERGNALASFRLVRDCHRHTRVRMNRVSDEVLRTIYYPAAIRAHRCRFRSRCVRSGARFGESPSAEVFTTRQRLEILATLRFSSVLVDMIRTKRIMHRHRDDDRSVNTRKTFNDRRVFDITHARSAVLLRKNHTKETKLRKLRFQLDRKMLRLIPLHHVRRNLRLGKLAHTHLDLLLLFS